MRSIYPGTQPELDVMRYLRHLPTNIRDSQDPRGPQFIGFLEIQLILINRKNRDLS